MDKVNILVVEDSPLMQKIICDILSSELRFKVVDKVSSGKEALEKIDKLDIDVITLDINLPDTNGLSLLKEIMVRSPKKIVMLSAYTQKGAETTMRALELGAIDFIPKPSGEVSFDLYNFKEEIISKIKIVSQVDLKSYLANFRGMSLVEEGLSVGKVVVIAASTGGPRAIIEIMKKIPSHCSASFLIVQHMPKGFTKSFAERISWYSPIKTKEAEEGDFVLIGMGYLAPGGYNMLLERINLDRNSGFVLRLDDTALVNNVRPSADVTISSVAEVMGKNTIAVILTGMGKDGLEGVKLVKEKGGFVIAQDKDSCVVYGMPKAVVDAGIADKVLNIDCIAEEIVKRL
ncbi:MAG: chemotaxis response regulator protein-glutamate methylesterase [Candidatus Omnitrophica bacterium]|nr:chemotaxis response regulator protein-glutamate methylesterase [Candidatus Omnitrophota bacterium]MCM8826207.1 chemotaxis response regulator protein-glutamate methylesterase [Candidatus Omnitrophota bacterium]